MKIENLGMVIVRGNMMMKIIKVLGILVFFSLKIEGQVFGEEFPIGYPFITFGETFYKGGDVDRGYHLSVYVEQGVDWFKIGKLVFNTFVGLNGSASDQSQDYWNNRVGSLAGIKMKRPIDIGKGNWGIINIGARWEGTKYLSGPAPRDYENVSVLFLQWGFGGDWKKRQ